MQLIRDIYASAKHAGRPVISFEFFPPKTPEGERALLEKTIPALLQAKPHFCSVTYGAGGSTRDKTFGLVDAIQRQHSFPALAHLTCVNTTREQLGSILDEAEQLGIRNILALRGDPPGGVGEFKPVEGGFEFAYQLVQLVRERGGFCVGAAGFPEGHMACKAGKYVDWERLKFKVDQGAEFILTQLFFDNADFLGFRDHLEKKLGVSVPVSAGILPIASGAQIKRITSLCGARMPQKLLARLDALGDHDDQVAEFGIEYATQQCAELLRNGVAGLHLYCLNKAPASVRILQNLGLG